MCVTPTILGRHIRHQYRSLTVLPDSRRGSSFPYPYLKRYEPLSPHLDNSCTYSHQQIDPVYIVG